MHSLEMLESEREANEDLEGKIFELYEKTPNREFKSHLYFLKAESLCEAEDLVAETNPDYWKTSSVRPVSVEYTWDMFTQLYFSYNMAKSILGLDDLYGE